MKHILVFALIAGLLSAGPQTPAGNDTTKRDMKVVTLDSDAVAAQVKKKTVERSYALIIGISQYKNLSQAEQLSFAERDADQIYSMLINPEGGAFRAENIKRIKGPEATYQRIKTELETWLPSVTKEDDRVLIYFAGHGFIGSDGKGYLAPYDVSRNDVAHTAYPMDALGDDISRKIKGKWKVLVTDACHSGAISAPTDSAALNSKLQGLAPSLFSITASRDRESSMEDSSWGGGHGVFTYFLVQGLQGEGDRNGDGIVTADELGEYVSRNVSEATGGRQHPTYDKTSFDNNMPLAYPPARLTSNAPKPKEGTLVIEVTADNIEVFVDDISRGVPKKGEPFYVKGLKPGDVMVRGIKMGFEPYGPRPVRIFPDQETPVTINMLIPRTRKKSAVDLFEKGYKEYRMGSESHYKVAAARFEEALKDDPKYSLAALYAARAYHATADEDNAKRCFEAAIAIDPDYLEARANFAGMLLDIGAEDDSILQLDKVVNRDPGNAIAYANFSQAYFRKGISAKLSQRKEESQRLFTEAVNAARKSIQLAPNASESHLWLAESLRSRGDYKESLAEYGEYLRLSDFDTGIAGKVNYYVLGYLAGIGKKKRAAQTDIWREMRNQAYFGMCDSQRRLKQFDDAVVSCRKSIGYDPQDPYAKYALGLTYHLKAATGSAFENLTAARQQYTAVLAMNPDLAQAADARSNLANVEENLKKFQK